MNLDDSLGSHDHAFLGVNHARHARRVQWALALTGVMMVGEIAAGYAFGSMALLADGWHMATHLAALGISALAYVFARRHAGNRRFSFGTGKFGDLGAYTSALLLGLVAIGIAVESVERLMAPVVIRYPEALAVAVLGLLVNIAAALLLKEDHAHWRAPDGSAHAHSHAHDHNLRSAYMHMLADAATSVLAILGIGLAWGLGWVGLDPIIGIVGAIVILRWAYQLIRSAGAVLLDAVPSGPLTADLRAEVEELGDRLADLHVWRVGPGHLAAIVSIVTEEDRDAAFYRQRLLSVTRLSHVTIEVLGP
jgi:cation diffusion facilitator family transporter